uniref:Uncharacterized protein n=1 Tax=Arundo donax TaxID=35708 RepID=A0A0A9B429_ARUDO
MEVGLFSLLFSSFVHLFLSSRRELCMYIYIYIW